MKKSIRTFVAIKIIPNNKFAVLYSSLKKELENESIKWVEANNFHLTLHFLGETSSTQLEQIKHLLRSIVAKKNSFDIQLCGLDIYKSKGKPRVLYIKAQANDTMLQMTNEIKKAIIKFGFKKETKEFAPHLTLGRIKFLNEENNLSAVLQQFKEEKTQVVVVNEIILYQSILQNSGPIYQAIEIFKLNKV